MHIKYSFTGSSAPLATSQKPPCPALSAGFLVIYFPFVNNLLTWLFPAFLAFGIALWTWEWFSSLLSSFIGTPTPATTGFPHPAPPPRPAWPSCMFG